MRQLLLRELKVTQLYILIFIIFIPISYGMNVPSTGVHIWIVLGFLPLVFYFEHQNNVKKFDVSLPLRRNHIVMARYLYLILITVFATLFLWLIDFVAFQGLPFLENNPLTSFDIMQLFTLLCFLLSIYIPVFYYFRNFAYAMTVIFVTIIVSVYVYAVITGNPYITFDDSIRDVLLSMNNKQPFILLLLLSFGLMYLSYLVSTRIFARRDIL